MFHVIPYNMQEIWNKNDGLGSDHLTRGGWVFFEKKILALIFVKKNILASTQTKKIV